MLNNKSFETNFNEFKGFNPDGIQHENALSSNKTTILSDDSNAYDNYSPSEYSDTKLSQKYHTPEKPFAQLFQYNYSNPLLCYSTPVFSFINRIRNIHEYQANIFEIAIELVNEFIIKTNEINLTQEIIQSASYMLCMIIDEVALKCHWSYETNWINKGILDSFFQQSQDDGYFLGIIEYYLANQSKNKDILEYFSVCLSVCTKGQDSSKSAIKFENIRHKILSALKQNYSLDNLKFSPHGIPTDQVQIQQTRTFPTWIIYLSTIVLLTVIYSSYRYTLSILSEPIAQKISKFYPLEQNQTKKQ